MKKVHITVIIPAYNECKHIGECLLSVAKQTYPLFDTIVVDDGSTDETATIAKQYPVTLLSQAHLGAGFARNGGAKKAKGTILVFVDADMFLDKKYLEIITKPIREGKASATFTKEEYIANPTNIWSRCFSLDNGLSEDKRIAKWYPETDTAFRAIQKNVFFAMGGYKEQSGYGEDKILDRKHLAIAVKGAKCYHYNPDTLSDVFYSARWIGRGEQLQKTIVNALRYSLCNSIRISMQKIARGAPLRFLIYKSVFDFGVLLGMLYPNIKGNRAK